MGLALLPAILLLALSALWPLLRTLWLAFTDARFSTLREAHWVGLQNFGTVLSDPDWWHAVKNTMGFASVSVGLETLIGLGLALALNSTFRGRGALRASVLIPWAIPAVVSARMWAWMFNDLYGVINSILLSLHMIREPLAWLARDPLPLVAVILVDVWKSTPFMALLMLAGLQAIPASLHEAARLEGAGAWTIFRRITLPLLAPTIWIAVIFRTLDALRVFDLPYVLIGNTREHAVISVYARQQLIEFQSVGVGSAASILVFASVGIVIAGYLAVGRKSLGMGG